MTKNEAHKCESCGSENNITAFGGVHCFDCGHIGHDYDWDAASVCKKKTEERLMKKNEAHEKFIRWIEAHPSDQWRIVGGDLEHMSRYHADAYPLSNTAEYYQYEHIVIKYEAEND